MPRSKRTLRYPYPYITSVKWCSTASRRSSISCKSCARQVSSVKFTEAPRPRPSEFFETHRFFVYITTHIVTPCKAFPLPNEYLLCLCNHALLSSASNVTSHVAPTSACYARTYQAEITTNLSRTMPPVPVPFLSRTSRSTGR